MRTSDRPMVDAELLGESPGLPSSRLRSEDCDHIDPAAAYRLIAANGPKTFSPEHLTRAQHIVNAVQATGISDVSLPEGRARDSQSGILGKPGNEEFKIFLIIEGDVCIQVADHFIIQVIQSVIADVECVRLCGKSSLFVFGSSHQFNPIMLRGIIPYDVVCAVRGAIADDHPLHWSNRLRQDRLDGQLNKLRLVPRWGNENIRAVANSSLPSARRSYEIFRRLQI